MCTYVGVSGGLLQQLVASVNATWLAALPGDVSVPDQPVLQGATQGIADSTGYMHIPSVVLLATAGVYNLSLTLQGYPEVRTWAHHFLQTQSGGGRECLLNDGWSPSDIWHCKCMRGACKGCMTRLASI